MVAMKTLRLHDSRPPLAAPAMSTAEDAHTRLRLTNRWIEIDGVPRVPVTGEMHFSRVPRRRWEEQLRLLLASGLTSVSTYVFWIHHERERGAIDFTGDLDLAAFLDTAERVGIDVILRIGPWCHGEVRGGGLPDWVLSEAGDRARTDDPGYLALVEEWFGRIAAEAGRFCGPDRPIIGIQIENELHERPQHLATLKNLARRAGLSAPMWTATAWGGAELPPHELFPLYSGYADGFWAGQGSTWDDSFRDHFRFGHVWDDPGVGGDLRAPGEEIVLRPLDPEFPPSTCELGGGMATAYHRRPIARASDIAALANVKIGNGSAWQGFYMYVGGVNPADHLQESLDTGYPNDLPRFDYDFQAGFGATGRPGPNLGVLRDHNAFLAGFGDRLADMFSALPDDAPVDVHDHGSLRWAVRTDGRSGFLFVNTHQPHEQLAGSAEVQFRIPLEGGDLLVPDQPIDIPAGLVARWPLRLDIAGVGIEWATASVSGLVDGRMPTLVLRAHHGVSARVAFAGTPVVDGVRLRPRAVVDIAAGAAVVVDDRLTVLVVGDAASRELWYFDGELISSPNAVWRDGARLLARAESDPGVLRWSGERFVPVAMDPRGLPSTIEIEPTQLGAPRRPPARYGESGGRSAAPTDAQFDEVAGTWRVARPERDAVGEGDLVELVIDWAGDVAQLRADGAIVQDRFWDGLPWRIDITAIPTDAELTLHIAPIGSHSEIDLDPAARALVDTAGVLGEIKVVRLVTSVVWTER